MPGASELNAAIGAGWIEVVIAEASPSFSNLGAGEATTLTYATRIGALALLDDQAGRSYGRKHQLSVLGTVGVLVAAKRAGLVDAIAPLLDELRNCGFRLSDDVIDGALTETDERGYAESG